MKKVLIGAGVLATFVIAGALGAFDDDGPSADQQEKAATACLRAAGLEVEVEIPPYSRVGARPPLYELDVDAGGGEREHVAYVYLFDYPTEAENYVDDLKLRAETEPPTGVTIEQRGRAGVEIDADAPEAASIRACVDKAVKPVAG